MGWILWNDLGNGKWMDTTGSGQGPVVDPCEHSNESSGSIKDGDFLDWLSDYYLLKDSAPWSC
jgi:hypothetical protein